MNTAKNLGKVLIRGIMTIFVVPALYYVIKMFLNSSAILAGMGLLNPMTVFIVQVGLPVAYLIGALLYTFWPVISPQDDQPQQPGPYYRPPTNRF